ncbi:MAG: Gp37 family protein [Nostoc sp.]|uniref:Gp37 family protein n=1 Tax=Nostoc sp. TaxID=1180 RepID=UPI002FEFC320
MLIQIKQAIALQLQPLSNRARIVVDDSDGKAGSAAQVTSDYTLRIGYTSATFTPPDAIETVGFQFCNRAFQISIEIKDFRNEDKAIALIEDIENLLMGFRPCVKGVNGDIYLESDRFAKNDSGIYFYVIQLTVPCFLAK